MGGPTGFHDPNVQTWWHGPVSESTLVFTGKRRPGCDSGIRSGYNKGSHIPPSSTGPHCHRRRTGGRRTPLGLRGRPTCLDTRPQSSQKGGQGPVPVSRPTRPFSTWVTLDCLTQDRDRHDGRSTHRDSSSGM